MPLSRPWIKSHPSGHIYHAFKKKKIPHASVRMIFLQLIIPVSWLKQPSRLLKSPGMMQTAPQNDPWGPSNVAPFLTGFIYYQSFRPHFCSVLPVPLKVKVLVAQLCPTLCHPMHCSLPGSAVHGIFQGRIPEWVAIPFSRGSSPPRDQTWVSCIVGRFLTHLSHQGSPWSPWHGEIPHPWDSA